MIVKIEMAVEAIQEAQRWVAVRKAADMFAKGVNDALNNFADFIECAINQLEEEQRKAEGNNDTGKDGQGRQV